MKATAKQFTAVSILCLALSTCARAQANVQVKLDPNYPYTREYMTTQAHPQTAPPHTVLVIALGDSGPTLFGVQYDGSYYQFVTSADEGATWQETGSWVLSLPGYSGAKLLGMTFMSNSAFVYTDAGSIFRTSLPLSASSQWSDVSVPTSMRPTLPVNVPFLGRPGSLVAQGTYLFYGNYNLDPNVPPQPPLPPNNQGAHLYRSSTLGDSWIEVLTIPYARHVHTIGVDPKNKQNIYVSVGDGGYQGTGLYLSTSGGDAGTFTQISANRYGIDFAFPDDYPLQWTAGGQNIQVPMSRVLLEGDRPPSLIESFDRSQMAAGCSPTNLCVTDSLITADDNPPDGVSWRGSSGGIEYTREGNLFWVSSGENGAIGLRAGVWMALGPMYTNWVLLEDLAPPISSASIGANCMVTITTMSPLMSSPTFDVPTQVGTEIVVDGTSSSWLNGTSGTILTIAPAATATKLFPGPPGPSSTTLTYQASPCPAAQGNITGGVTTIVTGWEYYKTLESANYLFNSFYRIQRPQFINQKRGQRLW